MDSNAEPIVQTETPSSGAEEQVKQDNSPSNEAVTAEPLDEDDIVLQRLLDELAAEEPQPTEASAPVAAETTPEVPTIDREAVAKILKRDGVPDEVISSTSPEILQQWADAAVKRQKDVDSYGGRLKEMEARLATSQQATPAQGNTPVAAEPTKADPFAQMAQVYGEELVAPVRAAFVSQQQQMQEQLLLAQARAADASLRVQYGAKSPTWDAVLAKMSELGSAKPGGYASVDSLAAAAYSEIVGSASAQPTNVRAAQPTAPTKGNTAPVKPPVRDEDDLILDQILSGEGGRLRTALRK
jgi:hypothetical protein